MYRFRFTENGPGLNSNASFTKISFLMIQSINGFLGSPGCDIIIDWQIAPVFVVLLTVGILKWRGRLRSVPLQLALMSCPGVLFSIFWFVAMSVDWDGNVIDDLVAFIGFGLIVPTNIVCPVVFVYQLYAYFYDDETSKAINSYSVLQLILMFILILLYAWEQLVLPALGQDS